MLWQRDPFGISVVGNADGWFESIKVVWGEAELIWRRAEGWVHRGSEADSNVGICSTICIFNPNQPNAWKCQVICFFIFFKYLIPALNTFAVTLESRTTDLNHLYPPPAFFFFLHDPVFHFQTLQTVRELCLLIWEPLPLTLNCSLKINNNNNN